MPEGPTILILKEQVQQFVGKDIIAVEGNTKIDLDRLLHQRIIFFKSWGKHFLIGFEKFTIRIQFLLFGSYLINDDKTAKIRLGLTFDNGTLNFYVVNIKILDGDLKTYYDWKSDIMSDQWNSEIAMEKLKTIPNKQICDSLLQQDIFSGVGNIIKNEVLYRVRVHPKSDTGKIPKQKIEQIITQARAYSFEFMEQKKADTLKNNWLAYTKKICLRCDLPFTKEKTGSAKRSSYYCENCQIRYS